jgi:hypothetical protein
MNEKAELSKGSAFARKAQTSVHPATEKQVVIFQSVAILARGGPGAFSDKRTLQPVVFWKI